MQFSEGRIRTIAAQHLRLGHRRQRPRLIGIPQDKLTSLERSFPWVAPSETAPLDHRLTDAVSKAEVLASRGKLSAILAVDHRHARQLPEGLSCTLQDLLQARAIRCGRSNREMDIRRAKRLLPVLRTVFAHITQFCRACGHPLPELW